MLKMFLENKDFRNFLLYGTFSGIASGIFGIFMMWVIHDIFHNPFYTGLAGVMFVLPKVLGFVAGPFVDKSNKANLVRIGTFLQLVAVSCLLVISRFGYAQIWMFLSIILLYSVSGTIKSPAGAALLPKIVDGNELMRANVAINIVATLAGIGVGAGLYVMMSDGSRSTFELVYAANIAILVLALFFSLFLRDKVVKEAKKARYLTELKEGFAFIRQRYVVHLVVAFLFMGLFSNIAYVNLPLFAEIHTGSAQGYILLSALALFGGVIGSYLTRAVASKFEVWKILVAAFVLAGVARIVFVHAISDENSRFIWIYLLYAGLGSVVGIVFQTLMQKLPPKPLIARIDTINTSLYAVFAAIGAFLGGFAVNLLPNADTAFIVQGASYIVIGLCLCASKHLKTLPKIDEIEPINEKHPQ